MGREDFSIDEEHDQNRMLPNKPVLMELARTKWQIYFSHLTERTDWTIHLMMEKSKLVKEIIKVTKMTNLELT
jgi:hypothetical protein